MFVVLFISIMKMACDLSDRFGLFLRATNGRCVELADRSVSVLFTDISQSRFKFAEFVDPPNPDPRHWSSRILAAGREFVLTAADTQIIFVCAFVVSFVAKTKCELTAYRYGVALDIMNMGLSVIVCSVALVRTYWRHPLAAFFRTLLTVAAFICVALTVSYDNSFAPEWPPASEYQASAVLMPLACVLDSGLRGNATRQADAADARLGFHGSALKRPPERVHFIFLCIACAFAHLAPLCRRVIQGRHVESTTLIMRTWSRGHGWFVVLYWLIVLGIPMVVAPWAWTNVYKARVWVRDSGWISTPNTEWDLYNADQLIPGASVIILLTMAVLTELCSTQKKDSSAQASTEQSWSTGMELPQYRRLDPKRAARMW